MCASATGCLDVRPGGHTASSVRGSWVRAARPLTNKKGQLRAPAFLMAFAPPSVHAGSTLAMLFTGCTWHSQHPAGSVPLGVGSWLAPRRCVSGRRLNTCIMRAWGSSSVAGIVHTLQYRPVPNVHHVSASAASAVLAPLAGLRTMPWAWHGI